ncbi:hypothetical protein BGZ79_005507 [Entomortierella chlamydospora]|nr:hypothetical protein BGZ79_005507 [Entomortierella chlamydospora]
MVSLHSTQTPPKERQTVIDGFFEPIPGKQEQQHRFGQKSQFFTDDSLPPIDERQLIKACENDADIMHQNEPMPQAVPTSPTSLVGLNCEAQSLPRAQIVPLMRKTERRLFHSKTEANSRGNFKDPSKVHAGGIRLRSIQFARTISRVTNSHAMDEMPTTNYKDGPKTALVEIVGVLVSPMSYHNYCWDFTIRDPTAQDFSRKHSTLSSPMPPLVNHCDPDPNTLKCRMYDIDKSLDQSSLERDEILRAIGIVEQGAFAQGDVIQCVSVRR